MGDYRKGVRGAWKINLVNDWSNRLYCTYMYECALACSRWTFNDEKHVAKLAFSKISINTYTYYPPAFHCNYFRYPFFHLHHLLISYISKLQWEQFHQEKVPIAYVRRTIFQRMWIMGHYSNWFKVANKLIKEKISSSVKSGALTAIIATWAWWVNTT